MMARNGEQSVNTVVRLLLIVLSMVSIANLGLSVSNSRDITKINIIIRKNSHGGFAQVTKREPSDEAATFAKGEDNTSLELTPHPVYTNVMISKMIYPNTTGNVAVKRNAYLWWALGVAKLSDTGNGMYGLISNCRAWAGSDEVEDSRKFGCVYGAISTLITMGGAGYAAYAQGAEIGRILKSWYSHERKRREPGDSRIINSTLLKYQNFMVNISQSPMALMFDESANLITYNDTGLPIMFGINGKGDGMLVTYQPNPNNISEATAIYGFVPPPSGLSKRITYFNEENFVQGGLEAAYAYNQNSDGGWLSTHNDYGQMDHEVSCLIGDLTGNAYVWQIYDDNHGGTIADGAIRAFQYGTYKGEYLNSEIRGGIPRLSRCEVA